MSTYESRAEFVNDLRSAVTLEGDKDCRIDAYISDIPMMDAYFM